MPKPIQLDCRASGREAQGRSPILALEEGVLMVMPGGIHTITPSQGGRPVTVTVAVDANSATQLEKQRKVLTAKGAKPFFSVMHRTEVAAFWPSRFFWDKRIDATGSFVDGVWAEGEWTRAGREAVEGKDFRTFSPTFFVDAIRDDERNPAQVVCEPEAKANMGALENDPAFQAAMSPLWCNRAALNQFPATTAANAGAPGGTNKGTMKINKNTPPAELQARKQDLTLTANGLRGKTDPVAVANLTAAENEMDLIDATMALQAQQGDIDITNAALQARREQDADACISDMEQVGLIKPLDRELKAAQREQFIRDPKSIETQRRIMASMGGLQVAAARTGAGGAVARQVAPNAQAMDAARGAGSYQVGWDMTGAFRKYMEIVAAQTNIDWADKQRQQDNYIRKGRLALQAGAFYKTELAPNLASWEHCDMKELGGRIGLCAAKGSTTKIELKAAHEIQAADYSDDNAPSNVLGVLSGTLVLQRCLPKFAWEYPELLSMYTDFSDEPGLYNQTMTTHIVNQVAVQLFDPTSDGTGRPKGWSTVSPASVTDAPITLTAHIGVPIVFGQNQLAATARKLFDEQADLGIKSIADYFTSMLTALFTDANYNAYVTGPTATVPNPMAHYIQDIGKWSMTDLDALDAMFTSNKVPEKDRGIMLSPTYYAKLRGDPRLLQMYQASAKSLTGVSDFTTEAKLPKLSGFAPFKSPYLPVTNNLVGFAYQKSACMLKSRLPQDFTSAVNAMIPGSVTTITDPDTKISVMLVQYVSLQGGWAEWRPEVMLGTAVGDKRAGLRITSA